MLKQEKEKVVAELTERLRATDTMIVAGYRGLTMSEIDELRTKLLETGARFSVVKNTLTRLAAEAAGTKELLDFVDGPTAIAFLNPEGDPVAAAKVLNDTARRHDVLVIKGGILDGAVVSDAEVKSLATLPPTDVLQAQLEEQGEPVAETAPELVPEAETPAEEPSTEEESVEPEEAPAEESEEETSGES